MDWHLVKRIQIINKGTTLFDVPLFSSASDPQVTLLAGENGSGKSFLLYQLIECLKYLHGTKNKKRLTYSDYYLTFYTGKEELINLSELKNKKGINNYLPNKVIFCSNSVFDKSVFSSRSGKYYVYLGLKTFHDEMTDRKQKDGFIRSLFDIAKGGRKDKLIEVVHFLGYSSIILIVKDNKPCELNYKDEINCLSPADISDVYFMKGKEAVGWHWLSSGEKILFIHFSGIISNVIENSLLIVDEPEVSLHPKWQIMYLPLLLKIITCYNGCQIIISTHSHLLFSSTSKDCDILSLSVDRKSLGSHVAKEIHINSNLPGSSYYCILYEVFSIPSSEYHIELYDKVATLVKTKKIKDIDSFISSQPAYDKSLHEKTSTHGKITYKTLPTFIRNAIHHPSSGLMYTNDELDCSIDLLRKVISDYGP